MTRRNCAAVGGLGLVGALVAAVPALADGGLTLKEAYTFTNGAAQGGVEILSFTKDQNVVAGIFVGDADGTGPTAPTFGVQLLTLGANASLTPRANSVSLTTANVGFTSALTGVSGTALDPLGRGFGAVAVIPANNTTELGRVAFYNYNTGAVIGSVPVGFHPDSVSISADGSKIYVANEGEFTPGAGANAQAAGGISIIDVSGITSGNIANLPSSPVSTVDFSAANQGPNFSLSGIRNSNVANISTLTSVPDFTLAANQDVNSLEPEYLTVVGDKVYASLQESNAIGVFDTTTGKWTRINNLQPRAVTLDASDQDSSVLSNDAVKGLPMPDTIQSFTHGGKTYLVSSNEGDARTDDADIARFSAGGVTPLLDSNYPATAAGDRANAVIGRLNISRIDGDTDADGKIDDITSLGTRSFSIWEVATDDTLTRVWDSGSLETLLRTKDAAAHNMNRGDISTADSRSDDKGPEPEGLNVFTIGAKRFAAVMLERQNGVLLFDISDPLNPTEVGYLNTYAGDAADQLVSPEGSFFIPAIDSPTGTNLLLVGYEGHDNNVTGGPILEGGIGVIEVVPEPSSAALIALAGAALARRRRRATPAAH